MRIATLALAAMLMMAMSLSTSSAAEYTMYKWVDSAGIVHMEDAPPKDLPPSTKVEKISSEQRAPTPGPQRTQFAGNPGASQTSQSTAIVEIYVTSWCPYCKQAKEYLDSKGVAYKEYDVEKDEAALSRKRELSPTGGVPVAVINGQVVKGFASDVYDRALAKKR